MKTRVAHPEVVALEAIIDALDPLDEQQKLWVLQTAASRFSLRIENAVPSRGTYPEGAGASAPSSAEPISTGEYSTPQEFIRAKSPKTDVQRVTCLAYYLTKFRKTPLFKTKDLVALNTDAGCPKFSNPTVTVNNARRDKYLTPTGKGDKRITNQGEDLVDALPDQEKVKALKSEPRPRRRTTRKKK